MPGEAVGISYEKTERRQEVYVKTSSLLSKKRQEEIERSLSAQDAPKQQRTKSSGGFDLLLDAANSMMPPYSPPEDDDLYSAISAAKKAGGESQSALSEVLNGVAAVLERDPASRRKAIFRWIAAYLQSALAYSHFFPGHHNAALRSNLWQEVASAIAAAVQAIPLENAHALSHSSLRRDDFYVQQLKLPTRIDGTHFASMPVEQHHNNDLP